MRIFCLLTGLLLVLTESSARADDRPNILFILADDLGYGDVGCYGSTRTKTPNIDRLAAEGVRYSQFYVQMLCSPTRASAITGQFHSRWRIFGHLAALEDNRRRLMPDWLDSAAPSMPRTLQQAGYRTAHFGKWHLGGGSGSYKDGRLFINHPDAPLVARYGFDEVRAAWGNGPTWRAAEPIDKPHDLYTYDEPEWQTWSSRAICDAAIDFLDRHARQSTDRRFLIHLWLSDPHTPLRPADFMRKPYLHLPEPQQTHSAMVSYMDSQIGRVISKLAELNYASNTLVIFVSDNGAVLNRGGDNGALRGEKWTLYEGGIRVPFIARWPGHIPPGRVDAKSVLHVCDLAPTFCEVAKAQMPDGFVGDGQSAAGALLGKEWHRTGPLYWHHPTGGTRCPELAIRDGDWKFLVDRDGGRRALYNLAVDPGETVDVAQSNPEVTRRLEAAVLKWFASLPPSVAPGK